MCAPCPVLNIFRRAVILAIDLPEVYVVQFIDEGTYAQVKKKDVLPCGEQFKNVSILAQ